MQYETHIHVHVGTIDIIRDHSLSLPDGAMARRVSEQAAHTLADEWMRTLTSGPPSVHGFNPLWGIR